MNVRRGVVKVGGDVVVYKETSLELFWTLNLYLVMLMERLVGDIICVVLKTPVIIIVR